MVIGLVLFLTAFSQAGPGVSVATDSHSSVAVRSSELASLPVDANPESNLAASREKNDGAPNLASEPGKPIGTLTASAPAETASPEPIGPRSKPLGLPDSPRPVIKGWGESPARRHEWYALSITAHGAAAFDAWSTRRAVSQGAGSEANPLLRPFAHSGAMYAATQVCPALMDYVGRRMMRSSSPWLRKMWWLPQSASAAMSFAAGTHNVRIVK